MEREQDDKEYRLYVLQSVDRGVAMRRQAEPLHTSRLPASCAESGGPKPPN
jgi:hypothetical protein